MDECLKYEPYVRPDGLVVLDQYYVGWTAKLGKDVPLEIGTSPTAARASIAIDAGEDSMLYFFLSLMAPLQTFAAPPIDYAKYLATANLTMKWKAFSRHGAFPED